jgi:hypothetical protein
MLYFKSGRFVVVRQNMLAIAVTFPGMLPLFTIAFHFFQETLLW